MTTLLTFDPRSLEQSFGTKAAAVTHRLTEHPLLALDALARLADALPAAKVEHNRGDVPAVLADGRAPTVTASPGEIAAGIETNGCWMVLKNIELEPAYGRLLDDSLDELAPLVGEREGGMGRREGFVFLSAPGSVTPSHVDPEHNLLLQVRGVKEMNVGGFPDVATEHRVLEHFYGGGHRNIDHLPVDVRTFRLEPGHGVYVPPNAPHWVINGPAVSISLSITFRTEASRRLEELYAVNAQLRRLRLSPRPPGAGSADGAKLLVWRGLKTLAGRR